MIAGTLVVRNEARRWRASRCPRATPFRAIRRGWISTSSTASSRNRTGRRRSPGRWSSGSIKNSLCWGVYHRGRAGRLCAGHHRPGDLRLSLRCLRPAGTSRQGTEQGAGRDDPRASRSAGPAPLDAGDGRCARALRAIRLQDRWPIPNATWKFIGPACTKASSIRRHGTCARHGLVFRRKMRLIQRCLSISRIWSPRGSAKTTSCTTTT